MSEKLAIDVISDVVCPWCVIGYKRLEQAIQSLDIADKVELRFHPFELNPQMAAEGENLREHLANKYGSTREESIRARDNITQLGAELGFTFDYFDEMRMYNTRQAHLLLEFAADFDKQLELKLAMFKAFFGERKDISDRAVLGELLASLELPVEQGLAVLDDPQAIAHLEQNERHWQQLGVSAVPSIVFNGREGLQGAQPTDVYQQVLLKYLAEQS